MPGPIYLTVVGGSQTSSAFSIPGGRPFVVFVPSLAAANLHVEFSTSSAATTFHSYLPLSDMPAVIAKPCQKARRGNPAPAPLSP